MTIKKKNITTLTLLLLTSTFGLNAMSSSLIRYGSRAVASSQNPIIAEVIKRKQFEDAREMRQLIRNANWFPWDDKNPEEIRDAEKNKKKLERKLSKSPSDISNLNNIDLLTGTPVSIELLLRDKRLLLDYMKKNPGAVDVHKESVGQLSEKKVEVVYPAGISLFSIFKNAEEKIKNGLRRPFTKIDEELAAVIKEHAKK